MNEQQDKVKEELKDWIATKVIAEAIIEAMQDNEIECTLKNAQSIWLRFLESEINDGLESIAGDYDA
jgi:hypothetical protein